MTKHLLRSFLVMAIPLASLRAFAVSLCEQRLSSEQKIVLLGERLAEDPGLSPQVEIIHLPHLHASKLSRAQELPPVVRSQFRLAHFLLKNPDLIVIDEGLKADRPAEMWQLNRERHPQRFQEMERIFPDGTLPAEESELTQEQRDALVKYRATDVLYYLGRLKSLHRSISPEEAQEIALYLEKAQSLLRAGDMEWYDPTHVEVVYTRREAALVREALDLIYQHAQQQPFKPLRLALVYGSDHSFESYFQLLPDVRFYRERSIEEPLPPANVLRQLPNAELVALGIPSLTQFSTAELGLAYYDNVLRELSARHLHEASLAAVEEVRRQEEDFVNRRIAQGQFVSLSEWALLKDIASQRRAVGILDYKTFSDQGVLRMGLLRKAFLRNPEKAPVLASYLRNFLFQRTMFNAASQAAIIDHIDHALADVQSKNAARQSPPEI